MTKKNKRFFPELAGKTVLTGDMIPGFLEMKCIVDKGGYFRGSELSLPTAPKIDSQWVKEYEKGNIDAGCSIQKLINPFQENISVLKEQLEISSTEIVEEFFQYNTKDFRSIPAMKGLAIHSLSSDPLEGLVHYETLGMLREIRGMPFTCDIKPKSSANYCETPFYLELDINGRKFTASMHPDAYLFLKRSEKEYDIIIIDTKTNRITPYPEHKYLQQTFFYAWMIKQAMKKELDLDIVNIYSVFNKNAFHRGFGEMPKKVVPHMTYREQQYSPITVFHPEDLMHEFVPAIVGKIVEEKELLKQDEIEFVSHKERSEQCGYCKKCYMGHKLICSWITDKIDDGQRMEEIFARLNSK